MNTPTDIKVEFDSGSIIPFCDPKPIRASYTAGGQKYTVEFALSAYPDSEWKPKDMRLDLQVGFLLPGDVNYDDIKPYTIHPDARTATDRLAISRLEAHANRDFYPY